MNLSKLTKRNQDGRIICRPTYIGLIFIDYLGKKQSY